MSRSNGPFRPALMAAAVLAAVSGLAGADERELFFSDLPIVATASRLPQRLADAPASVTVIDREMIRASGSRGLNDLMRLVPGFISTPADNDPSRVAYHGLTAEDYAPRVQVLVDGRSLYSPLFKSGVNWNLLPVALEDIERIEVVRGSNGVSYGSNALLGIINIITQDVALTKGWMVSARHGNQSVRDQTLRWGGEIGGADTRLTVQQKGDGGLRYLGQSSNTVWVDPHDSNHSTLIDFRSELALDARDSLQIGLTQIEDVAQLGRVKGSTAGQPQDAGDPFRDYSMRSTALSLGWRRVVSQDEEQSLRFAHVDDWGSERHLEQLTSTSVGLINAGGRSLTNELEYQHRFALGEGKRVSWGGEYRSLSVSSPKQFYGGVKLHRTIGRVFANLEWEPDPRWLINAGMGLEADSMSGILPSPRLGVNYRLAPEHTLRFAMSRAYRTPSIYEARGDTRSLAVNTSSPVDRSFLAQRGLEAEHVDTVEAGYLADVRAWRASLDARVFNEYIPNRINVFPYALPALAADNGDRNAASFPYGRADSAVNNERVRIIGYEYQLKWQPFNSTRVQYGHSYTRIFSEWIDASLVAEGLPIAQVNVDKIVNHTRESMPRHTTSAMLIQQLPYGLQASVMYYKQAFMRWTRNSYVDPYERIDWRLAYPFRIGTTRAELAYTAMASNGAYQGLRNSRIVTETHWVSLRLDF